MGLCSILHFLSKLQMGQIRECFFTSYWKSLIGRNLWLVGPVHELWRECREVNKIPDSLVSSQSCWLFPVQDSCTWIRVFCWLVTGLARAGKLTGGEGSVRLIAKVACFVKKINKIFNRKRSWSKLDNNKRRSMVLSLPRQRGFPGPTIGWLLCLLNTNPDLQIPVIRYELVKDGVDERVPQGGRNFGEEDRARFGNQDPPLDVLVSDLGTML